MSEENKATIRRAYEAMGRGDYESLAALIADDIVEHEAFPGLEPTKEGVLQFFRGMRAAFPDLTMTAEDMVAEGDKVFVRGVMRGTHQGELMGMAPTGRTIEVPFADVMRIANGKFIEHWGVTDSGALMQQLGATEA